MITVRFRWRMRSVTYWCAGVVLGIAAAYIPWPFTVLVGAGMAYSVWNADRTAMSLMGALFEQLMIDARKPK